MQAIKAVFWNSNQRRLRTLWRLIGQILILIIVALVIEAAVGFIAVGMLVAQEGISPDQLSNPQVVQRFIMQNQLLYALSTLGIAIASLVGVWLAGRFLDRRPFADFGFHLDRNWWADFGFGLVLGAVLMLLIFLIELAAGWVTVTGTFVTRSPTATFLSAILVPLVTFLAVGFYEELLFRGYQLQNLSEGLTWRVIGPRAAILIATFLSSAAFGIAHASNPNASVFSTFNIFLAGFLLGAGYLLTGELAIPIALHITWNFFQGNVFGFPVSGADFSSATFISIDQGGPDLWTGGAFGPEAGLLGLGAMILGIFLTVLWIRWRYDGIGLELSLAAPPERSRETA
jgi:hypothetical protein